MIDFIVNGINLVLKIVFIGHLHANGRQNDRHIILGLRFCQ